VKNGNVKRSGRLSVQNTSFKKILIMKRITLALAATAVTNYPLVNMSALAQSRSIPLDEMTMVLATLAVVQSSCPQEFRTSDEAPLRDIVKKRGCNLKDFTPSGRYGKAMEARMARANQFIKIHGVEYGCTGMKDTIQEYFPELHNNDTSSEKMRLANELIAQHYNCHKKALDGDSNDSTTECDVQFRRQLNQNGLCDYVSGKIRSRFCTSSNDANSTAGRNKRNAK
jgi:hypothetical protein